MTKAKRLLPITPTLSLPSPARETQHPSPRNGGEKGPVA